MNAGVCVHGFVCNLKTGRLGGLRESMQAMPIFKQGRPWMGPVQMQVFGTDAEFIDAQQSG